MSPRCFCWCCFCCCWRFYTSIWRTFLVISLLGSLIEIAIHCIALICAHISARMYITCCCCGVRLQAITIIYGNSKQYGMLLDLDSCYWLAALARHASTKFSLFFFNFYLLLLLESLSLFIIWCNMLLVVSKCYAVPFLLFVFSQFLLYKYLFCILQYVCFHFINFPHFNIDFCSLSKLILRTLFNIGGKLQYMFSQCISYWKY